MSTNNNISQKVKDAVTTKYFSGISALALSSEFKISKSTIYKWVKYALGANMTNNKKTLPSKRLSNQELLQALKETYNMSPDSKAQYCRKLGIYTTDLDVFEKEILSASDKKQASQEILKLKKQNKELTQELSKKDKALSSTAALLILKKKADLLWGDDKDD